MHSFTHNMYFVAKASFTHNMYFVAKTNLSEFLLETAPNSAKQPQITPPKTKTSFLSQI